MVHLHIIIDDKEAAKLTIDPKTELNKVFKTKKSILDILLDNNIQVNFGCFGGSCSSCIATVQQGQEYINPEGLHPKVYTGTKEHQILTCISTIEDEAPEDAIIELAFMKKMRTAKQGT
ncbi:2Fe-2S iron-sulfur cluster binding domain-containing protein [Candidatus Woesearchaeota archaeon]|nr:2Fe-2S iron-sulfur cluster binding domain-containing protein [Nanoarchaeota archaeon]MCB9370317.1 2Fe-2S iron-sulfur cluster binding domain-containing protein [Candidatus Woesearchaeota archaeon]USN44839.1 MAG: 2Fe-2S iron-sulfur cluster binding domain-containing protein [Candidatus Woesearchaeota archaeon]